MRKILLALAVLLWASAAHAQFPPMPGMATPLQGGASFSGPCDQGVTCGHGWGAERMTSTYSGKLVNACLTSNHTTCGDISADTTGGLLTSDLTTLGCSGDTGCEVATFYDQVGSCNLVSGGSGHRADIRMTTTENGHADILFNGGDSDFYSCSSGTTFTSATLVGLVSNNTDSGSADGCALSGSNSGWLAFGVIDSGAACAFAASNINISNLIQAFVGTSSAGFAGSSAQTQPSGLYCLASQGSSSTVQGIVNGTADTAANPGSTLGNSPHSFVMGGRQATVFGWSGVINALVFINPNTSNSNANTVAHSMAVFWASSPPC